MFSTRILYHFIKHSLQIFLYLIFSKRLPIIRSTKSIYHVVWQLRPVGRDIMLYFFILHMKLTFRFSLICNKRKAALPFICYSSHLRIFRTVAIDAPNAMIPIPIIIYIISLFFVVPVFTLGNKTFWYTIE